MFVNWNATPHFTRLAYDRQVAAGTKIYAWTKVAGAADSKITVTFLKDGKETSTIELAVPKSPYRTQAYKTFRAGDAGSWTAVVKGADGAELWVGSQSANRAQERAAAGGPQPGGGGG